MATDALRLLLDLAPGLLCVLDERSRCTFLNAQGGEWLGIDPEAARGKPLSRLLDGAAWVTLRGHLSLVEHEGRMTFEQELRFAGPGVRRVRTTLAPCSNAPGVLVAMEDLHEQMLLEQRLQSSAEDLARSNAAFRTIIEQSPDGIFVHREGRVIYANPARARMMGYDDPQELIGVRTIDLVHPEDRREIHSRMGSVTAGNERPSHRLGRLLRKDGSTLEVEVIALPIVFEGEPALLSSARDMSERRRLITRMMEMDRMITAGTLAAGVGHEINNPLAYVLSNLEFALESLEGSATSGEGDVPEFVHALRQAREGALRVQRVTRDLRSLSRSQERDFCPVELGPVIDSAVNMAHVELSHRARLRLDLQPTPPVLGDDARLGQVLINLLINAAHAIEEGDPTGNEICVHTSFDATQQRVVIEVSDTGSGVAEEVADHLFDPFVTTKPLSQGTGLGLAICRQIVDSHQGQLTFRTQRGEGTTFRVEVPAAGPPVTDSAPESAATRQRARVLIIDDDDMLVSAFVRVLRKEHEVVAFTNGHEALSHLAQQPPYDVILCDLMMPEISGIEVFERVSQTDPEAQTRFLFMTGGAFTPRAQQFVQEHRERTLDKPIGVRALRQRVARHASWRRARA